MVLKADELKAVQKAFLGAVSGRNKDDLLAALEKSIFSFRESQLRAKEILNG
jgi:hypothetical protein